MDIRPARPAFSTRVFTLDELTKGERNTLQNMQNDAAHNIYFTPPVASLLLKHGVTTAAEVYDPGTRTVFYPANAPVNDKGLLDARGQVVLYALDVITTASPQLLAHLAPDLAPPVSGLNIIVGVFGCIDKLAHSGQSKRVGGAFCMADMAVRTLLFLGNYVPRLQQMAYGLISVQMLIKIGGKWAEIKSNAGAAQGRAILQGVQASALAANATAWPVHGLGMPGQNSPSVSALTQKPPPL